MDINGNTAALVNWVFITPEYVIDEICGPLDISNNNTNQDAISQSVYQGTVLQSDGLIQALNEIKFKAESSITLLPGFTVAINGTLIADRTVSGYQLILKSLFIRASFLEEERFDFLFVIIFDGL